MNEVLNIKKEEKTESKEQSKLKKRGRKKKQDKAEYQLNQDQTKFFVDLSKDKSGLDLVLKLLEEANKKSLGREITFRDLSMFGLEKITSKDIEKIQENSLSKMEKVHKALDEYNQKNNVHLDLGEFLMKKLALN